MDTIGNGKSYRMQIYEFKTSARRSVNDCTSAGYARSHAQRIAFRLHLGKLLGRHVRAPHSAEMNQSEMKCVLCAAEGGRVEWAAAGVWF